MWRHHPAHRTSTPEKSQVSGPQDVRHHHDGETPNGSYFVLTIAKQNTDYLWMQIKASSVEVSTTTIQIHHNEAAIKTWKASFPHKLLLFMAKMLTLCFVTARFIELQKGLDGQTGCTWAGNQSNQMDVIDGNHFVFHLILFVYNFSLICLLVPSSGRNLGLCCPLTVWGTTRTH